jgi:2-polyprenyl-3-methyl-5-hydroxy-6-metoxy-1,4-benzoquinol methylase
MTDPEFAANFTAAMDSRGASLAPALAEVLPVVGDETLLDIAGGSGIYACCIAAMHLELTAAVLEKPPVDRIARQAIARRNLIDRVNVHSGDMIAGMLPSGFDIHLYSHVLHDWDEPNVRLLLAKSFLKLNPGGMVAIYDMHINGEKTGPLAVAQYSALIMHSTRGKCYSLGELETILTDVGFIRFEYIPVKANRSLIIAYKPE